MEGIHGKQTVEVDAACLAAKLVGREQVHIDLGTGDGQFVTTMARHHPTWLAVGIDACRENLQRSSRLAPANALFLIASASALPVELDGIAGSITINFPWGTLLGGLLEPDSSVMRGVLMLSRAGTEFEIRLNAGALAEAGWSLVEGTEQIRRVFAASGVHLDPAVELEAGALRRFPSTWSKRIAFGRDPRGLLLCGPCAGRHRDGLATVWSPSQPAGDGLAYTVAPDERDK